MTKAEIVKAIAAQTGIAPKEVAITVEAFMEEIRKSLADQKENVYLRGFGSFTTCPPSSPPRASLTAWTAKRCSLRPTNKHNHTFILNT